MSAFYTVHAEAMAWLRYVKKCPLVATEVGYWSADVLGVDGDKSIELEIKKSKADLLAEFRNKATKHYLYGNCPEKGTKSVPSYLYFFVPLELASVALEVITEKAPKAGLAVLKYPTGTGSARWAGQGVEVLKRPVRLHKGKVSAAMLRALTLRMGSELVSLRLALENLKKQELTELLVHEIVLLAKSLSERTSHHATDDEESEVGGDVGSTHTDPAGASTGPGPGVDSGSIPAPEGSL